MGPAARLSAGVQLINEAHTDADFLLVTGDLAHYCEQAAYETLRDSLAPLEVPVHLMMGNHDSRAPFRAVFPDTPEIEGGFFQFALECDDLRILCLDSLNDVAGDHIGRLCETRLRWLDEQIALTPDDKRLIVANHHPAFDLGMPKLDEIKLADSDALCEVLERRKPDMFVFGHVHRPISGVWRGIPFHTVRGFNHQVALQLSDDSVVMLTYESGEENMQNPLLENDRL
jgi:Icc protein